jgi:hypothetical protein
METVRRIKLSRKIGAEVEAIEETTEKMMMEELVTDTEIEAETSKMIEEEDTLQRGGDHTKEVDKIAGIGTINNLITEEDNILGVIHHHLQVVRHLLQGRLNLLLLRHLQEEAQVAQNLHQSLYQNLHLEAIN